MSQSIKELTEFLRGAGVLVARFHAAKADGVVTGKESAKILWNSMGAVWDALCGITIILDELRDVDDLEKEQIIVEMENILRKSGMFTHRERDQAELLFRWLYGTITAYVEATTLPPTAELVE